VCWENFLTLNVLGIFELPNEVGNFLILLNECWENCLKFSSSTQLKKGLYVLAKDEILLFMLGNNKSALKGIYYS
jgi:hypothetical protein